MAQGISSAASLPSDDSGDTSTTPVRSTPQSVPNPSDTHFLRDNDRTDLGTTMDALIKGMSAEPLPGRTSE
jgi:hypothetical protein